MSKQKRRNELEQRKREERSSAARREKYRAAAARAYTQAEQENLDVQIDWVPEEPVATGGTDEAQTRFKVLYKQELERGDPAGDDPRPTF